MENQEPKHLKVLRIVGFALLAIGITLIILGVFVFKMEWGFKGEKIANPALYVPGMFLCVACAPCLFMGFTAKIQKAMIKTQKYVQGENKEDLTNIADTTADIASPAVSKITKAVKDGLTGDEQMYCKHCGAQIDVDSKFCKSCGKEQ